MTDVGRRVTRPVAPSGAQHVIASEAGDYRATIVEVGGGIRELSHQGRTILDGYGADEMCHGARGQPLIPWPNRIDHGRYRFQGEDRQLAITEPDRDCAIHGFVRWVNWVVAEVAGDRVTLRHRLHSQPGWPHVLDLEIGYHLGEDGLTVTVTATNAGGTDAPYGNGAHPYLTAGTERIDECRVVIPAEVRLISDQRGIPKGREKVAGTKYDFRTARRLGDLALDDAFTSVKRDAGGRVWTSLIGPGGDTVSLWTDENYPWLEVFTGDHLPRPDKRRTGLGVEPMTCPPNAYVTGDDLIVIEPGQSVVTRWGVSASRGSPDGGA
jgi:aldose 1-epimerase